MGKEMGHWVRKNFSTGIETPGESSSYVRLRKKEETKSGKFLHLRSDEPMEKNQGARPDAE